MSARHITPGSVSHHPWYRLIFTRRWLAYLLVTTLFAASCVGLGMWQFARREEARIEIERVQDNYSSAPVAAEVLLPDLTTFSESDKWRTVRMTGTYLENQQFLVRSRPREQQAGYEVLTPLKLSNGNIFIVDRGWLPAGNNADQAPQIPSPPAGSVTVTAHVKASEPGIPGREYNNGQLATIELPLISRILGKPTYTGAYGLLATESPMSTVPAPLAAIPPSPNEGNHLSYALQWLTFALLGFLGLGWAIRNEWRINNADSPSEIARRERVRARRSHRTTSEQLEDESIEEQLARQ